MQDLTCTLYNFPISCRIQTSPCQIATWQLNQEVDDAIERGYSSLGDTKDYCYEEKQQYS